MAFGRKVYGQGKQEICAFCGAKAFSENSQGLPVCASHKKKLMEDKKCVCGEYLEIKKSKWGAFYVCKNCGPVSLSKASDTDTSGYKLNKKFRKNIKPKEIKYEKNRIYTIKELEALWD